MPITSCQRIPQEHVYDLVPSFFLARVLERGIAFITINYYY